MNQTTRRNLLRGAIYLPAILAGGTAVTARTNSRVVIIGAGLAGLSAARDLVQREADVIIVEARDRIGGRIWTSRDWPDLPMDMGASWIHGVKGNPLTALAQEAGAKRIATSYDSAIAYDATGKTLETESATAKAEAVIRAARAAAEKRDSDISLAAAVQASKGWTSADPAARRMIRQVVNGTVEQEYGGDWSQVSAWHYDDSKEFGGGDELFPAGFDQITAWLARGLDIRLGRTVRSLAPAARGVRITFADGETLEADRVIVTLPLGVLRAGSVTFDAALSPARQRAIETLRMGLLNKCWLRFDRVAWPDDVDWIEWLGPEDGVWAQWVSLAQGAGLPVLLGFHAGEAARRLEQRDNATIIASAHDALKAMFGSSFPAPRAAQISRWSRDPFALGAYSFNAVGVTPQTRRDLAGAEWDGRLVFAGEAASAHYFGTAHGAVLSGRAAAAMITAG
jgi:monoamine oxidase